MLHKTKQQLERHLFTPSNRLPSLRSRQFLLNYFQAVRTTRPFGPMRAAMGVVRWSIMRAMRGENRIKHRASCIISGRARGTTQRLGISRTKVKELAGQGRLFGIRKSSW